jgi:hypothetical protein
MKISLRGLLGLAFVIFILIASILSARFKRGGAIYEALYAEDRVGEYLGQMECIKEALPAEDRIGFIYGEEKECESTECGEIYYLTEFAIAPVAADIDFSNLEWAILKTDDPVRCGQCKRNTNWKPKKAVGMACSCCIKDPEIDRLAVSAVGLVGSNWGASCRRFH